VKAAAAILIVIATLGLSIPGYAVGPGDEGIKVAQVQQLLQRYGYTVHVDGEYGPQTTKAVRSWQRSNGLAVDGIAGPATLNSLLKAQRGTAQQVTAPPPPPVPHYDQWVRLAECESGSRWDYNGGSGYDGALQFLPSTWRAMGGREFADYAWQASPLEQMIVAERTLDESGWIAWPTCSRKLGFR
jgi:Transglycosylase-like domain/Putative peptidoglycan binding domain